MNETSTSAGNRKAAIWARRLEKARDRWAETIADLLGGERDDPGHAGQREARDDERENSPGAGVGGDPGRHGQGRGRGKKYPLALGHVGRSMGSYFTRARVPAAPYGHGSEGDGSA